VLPAENRQTILYFNEQNRSGDISQAQNSYDVKWFNGKLEIMALFLYWNVIPKIFNWEKGFSFHVQVLWAKHINYFWFLRCSREQETVCTYRSWSQRKHSRADGDLPIQSFAQTTPCLLRWTQMVALGTSKTARLPFPKVWAQSPSPTH